MSAARAIEVVVDSADSDASRSFSIRPSLIILRILLLPLSAVSQSNMTRIRKIC